MDQGQIDVFNVARTGPLSSLVQILDADPSRLNVLDERGANLLIIAAANGRTELVCRRICDFTDNQVKELVQRGIKVDHTNTSKNNALMMAASGGHVDVVKLISSHFLLDHQNSNGDTGRLNGFFHFSLLEH